MNNSSIPAVVIEINHMEQRQSFIATDNKVYHLIGINRCPDLQVGDEGVLTYTPSRNGGLFWFTKNFIQEAV
jgi:hypothetical protein